MAKKYTKSIKKLPIKEKPLHLRISPGNLQTLRKNETIRYTKIGGIIFYKYEDIEEVLKNIRRA